MYEQKKDLINYRKHLEIKGQIENLKISPKCWNMNFFHSLSILGIKKGIEIETSPAYRVLWLVLGVLKSAFFLLF